MSDRVGEQAQELSAAAKAMARCLGSRKASERQLAEQQVCEMGDEGRDLLIAIMRYEQDRRRRRKRHYIARILLKLGMLGLVTLVLFIAHVRLRMLNFFSANVFTYSLGSIVMMLLVSRTQYSAALTLARHFDDVSIIGPLAEALEYRSKRVRQAAAEALIRLLPRVQETDEGLLTSRQRNNLHRALLGSNADLVVAILFSLNKMGNSQDLPILRKLAAGVGISRKDNRIPVLAEQTLACVTQRAEAQRAPHTLLRAASASGDELLRPAHGRDAPNVEELLRSSSDRVSELQEGARIEAT